MPEPATRMGISARHRGGIHAVVAGADGRKRSLVPWFDLPGCLGRLCHPVTPGHARRQSPVHIPSSGRSGIPGRRRNGLRLERRVSRGRGSRGGAERPRLPGRDCHSEPRGLLRRATGAPAGLRRVPHLHDGDPGDGRSRRGASRDHVTEVQYRNDSPGKIDLGLQDLQQSGLGQRQARDLLQCVHPRPRSDHLRGRLRPGRLSRERIRFRSAGHEHRRHAADLHRAGRESRRRRVQRHDEPERRRDVAQESAKQRRWKLRDRSQPQLRIPVGIRQRRIQPGRIGRDLPRNGSFQRTGNPGHTRLRQLAPLRDEREPSRLRPLRALLLGARRAAPRPTTRPSTPSDACIGRRAATTPVPRGKSSIR